MSKQATLLRNVSIAAVTATSLSLQLLTPIAHAQTADTSDRKPCKIVGATSHRCLNFHSDSTWPQGLTGYHGPNGGYSNGG